MQLLALLDFKASGEEGRQGPRKTFSMDSATYLKTISFTDLLFAGMTLPGFCLFNHMGSVTVTCSSLGLDFTTFFGSILVQITPPLGFSFINISASCILLITIAFLSLNLQQIWFPKCEFFRKPNWVIF
ncbi:hypothetical protein ACB098_12G114100 [Castanea mollissima]